MSTVESQSAARGYSVPDVAVRGVVSAVPRRRVSNSEFFDKFGESSVQEVAAMTGVLVRYWVEEGQTTSDLCFEAAKVLISKVGWQLDSIDALIFVSQTADQRLPATACTLQSRLGLSKHCQAFDVSLGCSGYVYGLWLSCALLSAGCKRVLLLAGDTSSRIIDITDRSTALLFGDAGSATALEATPGARPFYFLLGSDGSGGKNLIVRAGGFRQFQPDDRIRPESNPAHLFMDGSEIFTFTLRAVPKLIRDILAGVDKKVGEVDAFLLHQANRFMLLHIAKKVGIAPEQLPLNIDRFGNTSSASIPLLLCTNVASKVLRGPTNLIAVGFGVGYSWGAAYLPLGSLDCAEVISQ